MSGFLKGRIRSIQFALEGWWTVLRGEKNTWVHAFFSIVTVIAAFWLNFSVEHWVLLILTITMVWVAEFINSAIEMMIDLFSPETHPMAKKGKDIGAAAVLISAIASVLIGYLLFIPPLIEKIAPFFK